MSDYRKHWDKESNWRLGSLYVCKEDPRLVVAKKRRWAGWTFNFAHTGSYLLTAYVLAVALAPSLYVISIGSRGRVPHAVALSVVLALAVVLPCSRVGRG
jgi:uncharacterized membrane protein